MFKSLKFKKLTALLMTVFMFSSILTPEMSNLVVKADGAVKHFDLIEITDFHGNLLSTSNEQIAAVMAKDIKTIQAQNPDTLVLGGGDLYQGTPISNVLQGVPVQKFLSNLGMEVTTLGNHEFDWTLNTINTVTMKDSKYSIVCSNVTKKSDGSLVYPASKVITKDNVRIAVIGAITTETPNIVMPANVADYNFTDPTKAINDEAKRIKDNNLADVVIAVVHEGNDGDFKTTGAIMTIANGLTGVDAVLGGHSHTIMSTRAANGVPVVIGGGNGKGFADLKMDIDSTGKLTFPNVDTTATKLDSNQAFGAYQGINRDTTANQVYPYGYYNVKDNTSPAVDPEAYTIVQTANADVAPTFNTVIGKDAIAMTRTQDASPYGESQLGNWASDVVKNFTKADFGVANNGGLRCDINAGTITKGNVFTFMPFDNEINTVKVTGAQLKTMFEEAFADKSYSYNGKDGVGIQISGLKVWYDTTKASPNRVTKIAKSDGTAIDMNDTTTTYTLAGPDFVLTGGDGFVVFNNAAIKSTLSSTHKLVRDALMDDITKNGTIYTTMDNRIINGVPNKIQVIATSDVHGAVFDYDYATGKATNSGLTKVSTYVKSQKSANPNVMVVDNGDTIQGTPLSYYYDKMDTTSEYPLMKAMGLIGYDTWTLGNHEFNYGLDVLNRIIKDAQKENITVLSANTYNTSDHSNFVGSYVIKTFTTANGNKVNVGILGMTTPAIPHWEDASHYAGLTFEKDLVSEAQKYVDKMKKDGADIVILTVHSGQPGLSETIPEENQVTAIAKNVSGLDAIVAGHTHDVYADNKVATKGYISTVITGPNNKQVHITEPKNGAPFVSEVDIQLKADGTLDTTKDIISTQVINLASYPDDKDFEAQLQAYQTATLGYTSTVLGTSTGEFTGANQTTQSTALMDLVNKVQMEAAGTQLSIAAPLSAAAYIPKGNISIKDIMSVYVFENFLYGVKMTGAQLKHYLAYAYSPFKTVTNASDPITKADPNFPDYNLDQMYGVTYDIDLTQAPCTVTNGVVTNNGNRIKNLKYQGKLVNDSDVFTVAVNNYRFNGGGGFMKAAGLTVVDPATKNDVVDPSLVMYDSQKVLGDDGQVRNMMINYVKKHGVISPVVSNSWKMYTTPVAITNDQDAAQAVISSPDTQVTVNIDSNPVISQSFIDQVANSGKTITVVMNTKDPNGNDIQISFTGKASELKPVDLTLQTSPNKDILSKADSNGMILSFKDSGALAVPVTLKVKLAAGIDLTKPVYFYYFNPDTKKLEIVAGPLTPDKDGYVTVTIKHCSDYMFSNNGTLAASNSSSGTIVKTGSEVNTFNMAVLGSFLIFAGAFMVVTRKKEVEE